MSNPAFPDPSWALPSLLIVFAAICGGLRALLASPVRSSLLDDLPDRQRIRGEKAAESPYAIAITAGILRIFCLAASAALLLSETAELSMASKWVAWLLGATFAGILLEGAPSLVTRRRARRLVLTILPLVYIAAWLLRPITFLLHLVLSTLGTDPTVPNTDELAADLIDVARGAERENELQDSERRMIGRVMDLPDTDAAEIMTPRTEMTALPETTSSGDALHISLEEGHSRIPTYQEDLDHITGIFYLKDVLQSDPSNPDWKDSPVLKHIREPYFVPETMRVPSLLEEMRKRRVHLAVVVDEYGGTAGVVTIEDILEAIVGDIQDEHDEKEEDHSLQFINDDEALVDARMNLAELNEAFGCDLPDDEDYDTLAGLVFDRLGRIPSVGDKLQIDDIHLEVTEADDRRLLAMRLRRTPPPESSPVHGATE